MLLFLTFIYLLLCGCSCFSGPSCFCACLSFPCFSFVRCFPVISPAFLAFPASFALALHFLAFLLLFFTFLLLVLLWRIVFLFLMLLPSMAFVVVAYYLPYSCFSGFLYSCCLVFCSTVVVFCFTLRDNPSASHEQNSFLRCFLLDYDALVSCHGCSPCGRSFCLCLVVQLVRYFAHRP